MRQDGLQPALPDPASPSLPPWADAAAGYLSSNGMRLESNNVTLESMSTLPMASSPLLTFLFAFIWNVRYSGSKRLQVVTISSAFKISQWNFHWISSLKLLSSYSCTISFSQSIVSKVPFRDWHSWRWGQDSDSAQGRIWHTVCTVMGLDAIYNEREPLKPLCYFFPH